MLPLLLLLLVGLFDAAAAFGESREGGEAPRRFLGKEWRGNARHTPGVIRGVCRRVLYPLERAEIIGPVLFRRSCSLDMLCGPQGAASSIGPTPTCTRAIQTARSFASLSSMCFDSCCSFCASQGNWR